MEFHFVLGSCSLGVVYHRLSVALLGINPDLSVRFPAGKPLPDLYIALL